METFSPTGLPLLVATRQVFVHRGKLHIIPKPRTPAELTLLPVAAPTIREATQLVRSKAPTEASESVQQTIHRRICW